jgi:quercetin dioxygenase-like cupin family protein
VSLPGASLQPYIRQGEEHQRLDWTASPIHVEGGDDETFLLLDGAITVWVGDQRSRLRPGGIAFLPRQLPHAVRFDIASRALILSTPAGLQEGVFRAAGWT